MSLIWRIYVENRYKKILKRNKSLFKKLSILLAVILIFSMLAAAVPQEADDTAKIVVVDSLTGNRSGFGLTPVGGFKPVHK